MSESVEVRTYDTGDIKIEVRFFDGVAEGLKADFSGVAWDPAVASIQRNVILGSFYALSEKLMDEDMFFKDAVIDGVQMFAFYDSFEKPIALVRVTRNTLCIDWTLTVPQGQDERQLQDHR